MEKSSLSKVIGFLLKKTKKRMPRFARLLSAWDTNARPPHHVPVSIKLSDGTDLRSWSMQVELTKQRLVADEERRS